MNKIFGLSLGLVLFLSGCAASSPGFVSPQRLAAFNQNSVSVEITLQQDAHQNFFLTAIFTPESGDHLYSKDIPRNGLYGEGRPTLLELTPQSGMRSIGELTTTAVSEVTSMGSDALLVYPAGPVTLRQQVSLPPGTGWYYDQVSVTYMACTDTTCKTPVVGRIVRVYLPRMGQFQ